MYYVNCTDGSSPLARGTPIRQPLSPLAVRLIPARAGNTIGAGGGWQWRAAHPRSRGEHSGGVSGHTLDRGSSPLARGTQPRAGTDPQARRLIPARAGNTPHQAHCDAKGSGSSPLARGTLWSPYAPDRPTRLIPARAGNTVLLFPWTRSTTAHPRSRGEHGSERFSHVPGRGSSPLARGTRRDPEQGT